MGGIAVVGVTGCCCVFAFDLDLLAAAGAVVAAVGLLFALVLLFAELPLVSFLAATCVAPFVAVGALLLLSVAGAGTGVAALFSASTGGASSSLRFLPCLRHGIRGVERTRTSQGNLKRKILKFSIGSQMYNSLNVL